MKFLIGISFLVGISSAKVNVIATVNENRISSNERITIQISGEGTSSYPQVDVSTIKDFSVVSGPSQRSSFQIINGKVSSSYSLSWTLRPNKTGTLQIPPLIVKLDGEKYKTDPILIVVTKGRPGSSQNKSGSSGGDLSEKIFLEVTADKDEIYVGEQITVNYKLYSRSNLHKYSIEKLPKGVGFWQDELYSPRQLSIRERSVNGVRYNVATLYKIALFPTNNGQFTLEPMVVNCAVEVPSRFFTRTQQVVVESKPLTFNVKQLPVNGKPENFTGATGKFKIITIIDSTTTSVNEAVMYTVELSGTGNISLFKLPDLVFPKGLEVFEPKTTFNKNIGDDISGTKRLEYVIIPRKEGQFFLPRGELTFFNPKLSRWEKTSSPSISLNVNPSKMLLTYPGGLTKEEISLLKQDIRYIKTEPVRFKTKTNRLIPAWIILTNIIGVLLFASSRVVENYMSRMYRNEDIRRSKGAFKIAVKQLKEINSSNQKGEISTIIYHYFSSKLNLPYSNIDGLKIKEILNGNLRDDVFQKLTSILNQCEMIRFAPNVETDPQKNSVEMAEEVISLLKEIDLVL